MTTAKVKNNTKKNVHNFTSWNVDVQHDCSTCVVRGQLLKIVACISSNVFFLNFFKNREYEAICKRTHI